jgi:hypothetical protein
MNHIRTGVIVGLCAFALAAQEHAQGHKEKPGLYEVSTSMSMSGTPGNMPAPAPHTMQVCVTQAMVDKYGGPMSSQQMPNCKSSNLVVTPEGMSATVTCSGKVNSTGTVKSTFVDANTTKTTVNMTMTMGSQTVTTTTESTYTYKGPDCGSVKPPPMPASN